jgi:hypothetical protein
VRVTEGSGGVCVSRQGEPEVNPGAFQRKGASLFTMIPLERWNVERSVTFSSKSTKEGWHILSVRTLSGLWNTEVITTCHRRLERREQVNPLGSQSGKDHSAGTTNGGQWDSSGFTDSIVYQ